MLWTSTHSCSSPSGPGENMYPADPCESAFASTRIPPNDVVHVGDGSIILDHASQFRAAGCTLEPTFTDLHTTVADHRYHQLMIRVGVVPAFPHKITCVSPSDRSSVARRSSWRRYLSCTYSSVGYISINGVLCFGLLKGSIFQVLANHQLMKIVYLTLLYM